MSTFNTVSTNLFVQYRLFGVSYKHFDEFWEALVSQSTPDDGLGLGDIVALKISQPKNKMPGNISD